MTDQTILRLIVGVLCCWRNQKAGRTPMMIKVAWKPQLEGSTAVTGSEASEPDRSMPFACAVCAPENFVSCRYQ